jgi:hypothetical protein
MVGSIVPIRPQCFRLLDLPEEVQHMILKEKINMTKKIYLTLVGTCKYLRDLLILLKLSSNLNFVVYSRFFEDGVDYWKPKPYPNNSVWGNSIEMCVVTEQVMSHFREGFPTVSTLKIMHQPPELYPSSTWVPQDLTDVLQKVTTCVIFDGGVVDCALIPPHVQEIDFLSCRVQNLDKLGPRKVLYFQFMLSVDCKLIDSAERIIFENCNNLVNIPHLTSVKNLKYLFLTDSFENAADLRTLETIPEITFHTLGAEHFREADVPNNITSLIIENHACGDLAQFRHCPVKNLVLFDGGDDPRADLPEEWADTIENIFASNYIIGGIYNYHKLKKLRMCCVNVRAKDFSRQRQLERMDIACSCSQETKRTTALSFLMNRTKNVRRALEQGFARPALLNLTFDDPHIEEVEDELLAQLRM